MTTNHDYHNGQSSNVAYFSWKFEYIIQGRKSTTGLYIYNFESKKRKIYPELRNKNCVKYTAVKIKNKKYN